MDTDPVIDFGAALERVVASTGVGHYRSLCNHPDPPTRDGYRALVIRLDRGEALPVPAIPAKPAPDVAESLALTRAMRACPYRSTEGCGCAGGRCALKGGAIVSHLDCFSCLQAYPE